VTFVYLVDDAFFVVQVVRVGSKAEMAVLVEIQVDLLTTFSFFF
jgi:hypothetical protein